MLQWCFLRVILWLSNLRKKRVFSFIGLMWLIFKTLFSSLLCLTRTSLTLNLIFTQNPPISSTNLCKFSSKVCFLTFFSAFHFRLCRICFRVLELGIFENGLGLMILGKRFSKSWLGSAPFVLFVSVLAPCGNSNLYLGRISHDHALPTC